MPITIPASPSVQQDISSQSSAAAPDGFKNFKSSAGKNLQDTGKSWLNAGSRLQGLANEINKEVYLGKVDDEKRMLAAEKESLRIKSIAEKEKRLFEDSIAEKHNEFIRNNVVNEFSIKGNKALQEFLLVNGAGATEAFDELQKNFHGILTDTLDGLKVDEKQHILIANALNSKLTPWLITASNHSVKQLDIANTNEKKVAVTQSISAASRAIASGDIITAQAETGAALQVSLGLADAAGSRVRNDDDTLTSEGKAVALKVNSDITVGALTSMVAENDYKNANKLLKNAETSGLITDGAINKVRKAIATGSNMQEAQKLADTIYGDYFQAVEQGRIWGDGVTGMEGSYGQPSLVAMVDHVNSLVDANATVKKLSIGYLRDKYTKVESDFDKANKANYSLALKHKEAGQTGLISSSVMNSLTPEQRAVILDQWAEHSDAEALVTVINNPNLMVGEDAWQWAGKLTRADWKKLYVRANGNNKTSKGKIHASGDVALINQQLHVRGKNQLAGGKGSRATEKAKLIDRYYYQIEMLMEATDKPVDYKGRVEIINTVIDDIVYTRKKWFWGYGDSATNVSKGYVDSKNKTYADVDGKVYDMSTFTVDEIRIAKQQLTEESRELSTYEQKSEAGLTLTAANIARKALFIREQVNKNARGK